MGYHASASQARDTIASCAAQLANLSQAGYSEEVAAAVAGLEQAVIDNTPIVSALAPVSAELGGPDLTLHVTGTNFKDGVVIVFNGFDEPTVVLSASEVTTGVKPSLFTVAEPLPVHVRNPLGYESNSMDFTFTEPAGQ
jgi:IPT/TIG domain